MDVTADQGFFLIITVPSGVSTYNSAPCARIDLPFSKSKSRSLLSSRGKIGTPPFNLFLHPDLTLSVAAPFNAAVSQQVFGQQKDGT